MTIHYCRDGQLNDTDSKFAVYDYQRIFLFYACHKCLDEKKKRYRPEIFSGYDQNDVDEPIEPEE